MPAIITPDCIEAGARNMRTNLSSTIYPHIRRTSIQSSGFGSSPGGNACTTDTSHNSLKSLTPSRTNSDCGYKGTSHYVDYAQLFKTLRLVQNANTSSSLTRARPNYIDSFQNTTLHEPKNRDIFRKPMIKWRFSKVLPV